MTYSKKNIIFIFACLCFFILLNFKIPMIGEDFALSPSISFKETDSFFTTIHWMIDRIYSQSINWNARLGEQLAIVFLALPKQVFNVINGFAAIGYLLLVFAYAFNRGFNWKSSRDLFAIILIVFMVLFFMPVVGQIFFWETGSTNYLWSLGLLLLFGYPYKKMLYENNTRKFPYPKLVYGYYILAFLSGITNENTIVAFAFLLLLVYIMAIINKQKIYAWMNISSSLFILGILYLLLSPSTKNRANYYNQVFGIHEVTLKLYVSRLIDAISTFVYTNLPLLFIFASILIIFVFAYTSFSSYFNQGTLKNLKSVLQFTVISFISIFVLMLSPYVDPRSFFLAVTALITAIVFMCSTMYTALFHHNEPKKKHNILSGLILAGLLIPIFLISVHMYTTYSNFYNEASARNEYLKSVTSKENIIEVKAYKTQMSRILDPRDDYVQGNHQYYEYYNIKEIKIVN